MRRIPLGLVTLAAIACACAAQAGEPRPWKLRHYEAPNYSLVAPDDAAGSALPEKLAQVESLLTTLVSGLGPSNGVPVTIVLMPQHRWNKYFTPGELDAGRLEQRFSCYVLLPGWRSGGSLRAAANFEYAALYLRTHYPGRLPLWYEIGLGYLAYTASLSPDGATIGLDPFDSMRLFSPGGSTPVSRSDLYHGPGDPFRLPMAQLLRLEHASPAEIDDHLSIHAKYQAWKLVHRGFVAEPDLGQRFHAYLERTDRFETPEDAARQAFNQGLGEFDTDMAAYEQNSRGRVREIHFAPVAPPPLPASQDIEDRKMLLMVARAFVDSGHRPAKIDEIIKAAAKSGADIADLLALQMHMAIRDQDDDKFTSLAREAERRIRQPRVARELALALYERVHEEVPGTGADFSGRQAMRERALQLLTPRVLAQPDDVEAAWSQAMLAAALKRDLDVAQGAIQRARVQLPLIPDLALAAALVKGARGQADTAAEDLMVVVRFTPNAELRLWAARHVDVIRRVASGPPGS